MHKTREPWPFESRINGDFAVGPTILTGQGVAGYCLAPGIFRSETDAGQLLSRCCSAAPKPSDEEYLLRPDTTENGADRLVRMISRRPLLWAAASHLLFALLLFSPFFLQGKILVGSTDNHFHAWVNYMFSRAALANGDLGMWNPDIFCGIDFTASPHNHSRCPLDWPLFLLPARCFLHGLTIQAFLLVFLCGALSYLFFREEVGSEKWAYFASLIYQLGGYTFFSITTYSNTQLYALNVALLYLIWTADRRRPIVSYALWTLGLATVIVAANPLYSFAAFVLIGILFLYRYWPDSLAAWQPGPVRAFYGAALTAVVLTAAHWLPVTQSLLSVGTRVSGSGIRMECAKTFLGLGAFVPELFGINLNDSRPVIQALQPGSGAHAQFHGYNFFGVASILLVVLVVRLKIPRTRFWLMFLLLTSICLLEMPPFSAVLDLLTFPVIHNIIPKLMIPVAFCVLAGHAAAYVENNWSRCPAKVYWVLIATICAAVAVAIACWAHQRGVAGSGATDLNLVAASKLSLRKAQLLLPAVIALLVGLGYALLQGKRWAVYLLLAVAATAPAILYHMHLKDPQVFDNVLVRSGTAFLGIALAAAVLFVLAFAALQRGWLGRTGMLLTCLVLTGGTAGAVLYPSLACAGDPLGSRQMTLLLAMGLLKFIVLGLALVYVLATLARKPDLRPLFCPCLCTLLLIDLLPFNKNYSRQVTEAFERLEDLYPDRSALLDQGVDGEKEPLKTRTYRVNHPHIALQLSPNEKYTNLPTVYGVRIYGGLNSDFPRDFGNLIRRFEPSGIRYDGGCLSGELTSPKLLDLLGCGYDVDASGRLIRRRTALSRFMLFHRFEVVATPHMLDRLAKDTFVARDRLLVESDPGLAAPGGSAPPEVVSYDSLGTSELRVTCTTTTPALLFFGDSYHPDWRAYVDGQRQPVLRANANFMAVAIPAGTTEVRFRFRPRMFAKGLAISGVGAAGFLTLLVWATLRPLRRRVQPALPLRLRLTTGSKASQLIGPS
jgi:hypothetical protein